MDEKNKEMAEGSSCPGSQNDSADGYSHDRHDSCDDRRCKLAYGTERSRAFGNFVSADLYGWAS